MHQTIIFALAAVLSVTAAPTIHDAQNTKIPLLNRRINMVRDPSGNVNLPILFSQLHNTLVKHGAQGLPEKFHSAFKSITKRTNNVPLTDQTEQGEDELYYGSGTVGSQTFTFDFDTGSSDLFVPGPSCSSAQGCPGNSKYNQQGTDQGNTTSITYGSGQITGDNYLDLVTVGGLTAERQNVISLTEAEGFSTSQSDGLLGLAFESIANSKQPPFFQSLINEGKVTNKEFSFYLGRSQSNTADASELTLGGRDTSKYTGKVTTIPVTSQTYWQVALDAVTIDGKSAGASTMGQAAIDTGTTIILAPSDAARAIFAQIPGAAAIPLESGSSTTLYSYPCDFSGTVALQFGGQQFKINPLDFNFGSLTADVALSQASLLDPAFLQQLSDVILGGGLGGGSGADPANLCVAGIAGGDIKPDENLYVVGDTFLKNWYSIYSFDGDDGNPAVLFAAATGNQ